jgi:hypothetical protein
VSGDGNGGKPISVKLGAHVDHIEIFQNKVYFDLLIVTRESLVLLQSKRLYTLFELKS